MYDELRTYCRCEGLDEYSLRCELRVRRRAKGLDAKKAADKRIAERYARPLKAGFEWPDNASPAKVID